LKTPIIVVVDSNPVHRNLINYNLVVHKFLEVHTFLSREDCLYRLNKNLVPDFIITDVNPADDSALRFLQRVHEISPSVRVIFFSAFDNPRMATELYHAGASDYIHKTNKPDLGISELIKNIRYLLRAKSIS